jgi:PAS domain S-box-containing protein
MYGAVLDITERKQAETELQNQKEFLQAIFDRVPAVITLHETDGRIKLVNPEFERTLGWSLDEITNQNSDMLAKMYPDPQVRQGVSDLIQRADGRSEDFRTSTKDRRVLDISWTKVRLSDDSIIGVGENVTERKQAETTIRSLLHISENLHRNLETDKLLEALIIEAMKLTDSELGWVGLPSEQGMTLIRHISHNFEVVPFEYTWAPGVGWPGWVLEHKIPYVSNNAGSDKVIVPEIREQFGVKSGIDTPILDAHGKVIGFFEVNNKKDEARFSESDVEKLVAVSRIASIALQNSRLFEQVQDARRQLEDLSHRLLKVQESERRALTTELHDRVGQNLTGLSILLQNIKALLSERTAKILAAEFNDAQTLVQDTTRHIRDIMAELYLPDLQSFS